MDKEIVDMIVNIKSIYIEFDIFCILLLCVILYRMHKDLDQGTENICFRNVMISVLCGTVLDCLWKGFNGISMRYPRQVNKTIHSCVIIMLCIVAFLWLLYVEERLHDRWANKSAKIKCLLLLPLLASILMAVLSITTDTVLSLDQSNLIQYGKYYAFVVVFPAAYLLYASAKILRHRKTAKNRMEKGEDIAMLVSLFFPIAGVILSGFRSGIPAVWPCYAFPLFVIYVNEQGHQISTDKLTGLNNWSKFNSYLDEVLGQHKNCGNVYLFMCDIDSFKQINDTYGHYEGDQALKETANILKEVCKTHDVFLARYGGDEFAIIARFENRNEAEGLKSEIVKAFMARNENSDKIYDISLSIGISQYEDSKLAFINKADRAMYAEKRQNKATSLEQ
jgi:diguanylate cyclase (GGDEF) domain